MWKLNISQNGHQLSVNLFGLHLEGFLPSVISHMVIENISSVKGFGAIRALELLLLHVCLDVPLKDLDLCELFLAELTSKWFDQSLALLLVLLILQLSINQPSEPYRFLKP